MILGSGNVEWKEIRQHSTPSVQHFNAALISQRISGDRSDNHGFRPSTPCWLKCKSQRRRLMETNSQELWVVGPFFKWLEFVLNRLWQGLGGTFEDLLLIR